MGLHAEYEHLSPEAIQTANYFGSIPSAAHWAHRRKTPDSAETTIEDER